jgi:hypothetical protein
MYITSAQYKDITTRPEAEATEARIKKASLLLDARIGHYERNAEGWKLDLDGLTNHQKLAVRDWTAWMIAYLFDNNDQAPTTASISLGRFSVTEHGQKGKTIPEELNWSDMMLEDSGLINRHGKLTHRTVV